MNYCKMRLKNSDFLLCTDQSDQVNNNQTELPTFQEPWSEIIGRVSQVGKSQITILCSSEYIINCGSEVIRRHRNILRKGALVGILKVLGERSDELRIRTISRTVESPMHKEAM